MLPPKSGSRVSTARMTKLPSPMLMVSPSLTSRRGRMAASTAARQAKGKGKRHRSHRAHRGGGGAVVDHPAIGEADDAVAALREAGIVGDEHQGRAVPRLQREEQIDDDPPGRGIEIAGRLVGE